MATRLLQIVSFLNVGVGATVVLPHDINVNGVAQKPDFVALDLSGFSIVVTDTDVSVTNNSGAIASVDVWLELKHTIPRQIGIEYAGSQMPSLIPRPFIAASGSAGGGGGGGLLLFTVQVAKNGNDATADGSDGLPFLTIQAAMEYAYNTYVVPVGPQPFPGPYTRPCVFVNAGTYDDGDLVLPPQICVMGEGINHSRIIGNWTIDTRWSNYVPPTLPSPPSVLVPNDFRSSWINLALIGDVFVDFEAAVSNEGKIYAFGVRFAGTTTFNEKLENPVSNTFNANACEFIGNDEVSRTGTAVGFGGIPTFLQNCTFLGTLTLNQQIGGGVDNLFSSFGCSFHDVVINSTSNAAPPYNCAFSHGVQPTGTLTLNGPFSTVQGTLNSIPLQSNVVLAGGANINQITRVNQLNWSGITADRPPAPYTGQQYFDTTLGEPIWWDGAAWISGGGPWQRIGTVISEVVPTDLVVIGAAAPLPATAAFSVISGVNRLFAVDLATLFSHVGSAALPTSRLFINQDVTDHGSSADVQVSSLVANAPSYRCNQYGANAGIPGLSTIKSRGAAIGTLAPVVDGDVLLRLTAVGVPNDSLSVPLAGLVSIKVPVGGVGLNYVATDFEVQLVPLAGPINGRKQAFMVDSEGVIHLKEAANTMAGLAVTGAGGTILVPNTRIKATTKIMLTIQDGGVAPTNAVYLSARAVGVSFTIQAINPLDVGVQVYYQLYEPTIP